jgi:hypothetical protein
MRLLILKHRLFVASSLVVSLFSLVNADEVRIETRILLNLETSNRTSDGSSVGPFSNRSFADYRSNKGHFQRNGVVLDSGILATPHLNSLWRTRESFFDRTTELPDFDFGKTALAKEGMVVPIRIGADLDPALGGPSNVTLLICGLTVMLSGSALFLFQKGRKPRQRRNVYR